jgi:hypothetical protein
MGGQDSHQSESVADALAALQRVSKLTADPASRFAVVMYQAAELASDLNRFLSRLRVGREAAERLKILLELASLREVGADPGLLLQTAKRLQPVRQPQRFAACELCGQALWPDTMPGLARHLRLALTALEEVDVAELRSQGLEGAALGAALQARQLEVLSKRLVCESC